MTEIGEQQFDLDSLYSWIDTVPLSRPKKMISRDFADGVLIAEVISHFIPKLVDLHNYPPSSSWSQKKVNWQTLNRRVFPKIGMRINDVVISQLIDAKQGVIEQVLWDLRSKLQVTIFGEVKERRSASTPQSVVAALNNKCNNSFIVSSGLSRNDEPQLTYRVTSGGVQNNNSSNISINSPGRTSRQENITLDIARLNGTSRSEKPIGFASPSINSTEYALESSKFGQGFLNSGNNNQSQTYIAPPNMQKTSSSSIAKGPVVLSPILDKHNNTSSAGPAQIIYRGHKMIPLQFLDDKDKEIKALEVSNRTLTIKIHRLENLVNVKDQRIEDLTHQLQNLRFMYERVTENAYSGVP